MIKAQTLKGFRDFLPSEARKRQYVIQTVKEVFASFGFEPLETPALEYEEVLLGKYGDEGDKLMYRFKDNGDRNVALRYDQTVPLARVVAQYQNELSLPFKRYQIQPVWRAENTQKGRFREFVQCDIDTVGTNSPLSDAETILVGAKALDALGFQNYRILINDRAIFQNIDPGAIIAIDKLKKIGEAGVIKELVEKGFAKDSEDAQSILNDIQQSEKTERLELIFQYLKELGLSTDKYFYTPTLARGLDYYTSTIIEIEIDGYTAGSVCGGGRYDNLLGMFAGRDFPAVGFAFGFDRIIDAMNELMLFPPDLLTAQTPVLVTIFNEDTITDSLKVVSKLRDAGVHSELFPDAKIAMGKQYTFAEKKGINYIVVVGPKEIKENKILVKDLIAKTEETLSLEAFIEKLV